MAYFKIKHNPVSKQFYFGFFAENHEQILSSETYDSKQGCQNGINAVKAVCEYDVWYRRTDKPFNYRFTILATNYKVIAESSEGYDRREGREHAIGIVQRDGRLARVSDES